MPTLDGKVALVTGATRGIGLATAQALITAGARVVVTGREADAVARIASALGESALGVRADVRNGDDVAALFDETVLAFGGVDILVNNAGVGSFRKVADTSLDEWLRVFDTNVTGVFLCTRTAVPLMRARGGGWIINISSLASTTPFADGAAYCASKAALNAFTEALMQEVRHDDIRVAVVLPGSVKTDFMRQAEGRTSSVEVDDSWKLQPEDVARTVMALLEHSSRSLPSRVEIRPARPARRR